MMGHCETVHVPAQTYQGMKLDLENTPSLAFECLCLKDLSHKGGRWKL